MDARAYTNAIAYHHSGRLGKILSLTPSMNGGVDLLGDTLGIELKCRSDRFHPTWAIHSYQIDEFPAANPKKELYWGFVLYHLRCPVERIPKGAERWLGLFTRDPRVWLMPWDWVRQFPISTPKTGPYAYVHGADLPTEGFTTEMRLGYTLHVPLGSNLEERVRNPPALPSIPTTRRYVLKT